MPPTGLHEVDPSMFWHVPMPLIPIAFAIQQASAARENTSLDSMRGVAHCFLFERVCSDILNYRDSGGLTQP